MNTKKIIKKTLIEAKFLAKPEQMDKLEPKLKPDDIVKLVDENQEAEITEDENERAGRGIEYGASDGELSDTDWEDLHKSMNEDMDNSVNPDKLRVDVAKFMDKLNLQQFEHILSKIDKPVEQAEIIAAFAERIGVPRAKLPMVISTLKNMAENKNPTITKSSLVEYVSKKI